jgi:hypothetical protein
MIKTRSRNNASFGGALVYIFIGVILFGALAFSFAKGMRSGSTDTMDEKTAKLVATDLIGYANTVAYAVSRLQANGCSETEITFENPYVAGYTNASAPIDKHCHVFDPAGGNVQHLTINTDWLDGTYSANTIYGDFYVPIGRICVQNIGTGTVSDGLCGGSSPNDVIFVIPYLKREICIEINNLLGVVSASGAPPQDGTNAWPAANQKFTGAFGPSVANIRLPGNEDKLSACFEGSTSPVSGSYHFMTVVLAR